MVQFFCWFAFLFMWTYTNGTIARNAFNCPETVTINGITSEGKNYDAKNILLGDSTLIISHGKALVAGVDVNGKFYPAANVIAVGSADNDTIVNNRYVVSTNGKADYEFGKEYSAKGGKLLLNGYEVIDSVSTFSVVDYISRIEGKQEIILAGILSHDPHTGALFLDETETVMVSAPVTYDTSVVLNTESEEYNAAGNWVGILFAIQAIGSVLWACLLPIIPGRKFSYSLSLILGGIGFVTAGYFTDPYLLFASFALIGCAWAAMLAWPFTILTNSLKGGNIGAYLGLFNCSICIPQIIGALVGGWILSTIGSADQLAPQYMMMVIAGISLFLGSIAVIFIKEKKAE
ncbi:MAG: MFS transporter [Muribaculaceae bacterium]|nr:MFS transporter [Muribaculaceae bacterium]